MSDALATYLHDHLAGSNFAVELLKHLHDQHAGEPLGEFAAALLAEVEQDREVLRRIMERVGAEGSTLKDATAWVGEKVSRLKLGRSSSGEAGTFHAVETLALGILGKLALWRALSVIKAADVRMQDVDLDALAARAQAQHASVEEQRLQFAATALRVTAE